MQIVSTNISKPTLIDWRGQQLQTGIYKKPVDQPIYLGKNEVKGDTISDRKVHGGEYKACYLFSKEQYSYWRYLYPNLSWDYGMLGENLSVSGLDEEQIHLGDIYTVGEALIQITQPREPCYKFGIKFGTQKVLKQFIDHGYPGTYVRVLEQGFVKKGDDIVLVEKAINRISTYQFFNLLFAKTKDQKLLELAITNEALPHRKREKLKAFLE